MSSIKSGINKFLNNNQKKQENVKNMLDKINIVINNKNTYIYEKCIQYIPQDDYTFELLNKIYIEIINNSVNDKKYIVKKYSEIIVNEKSCNNIIKTQSLSYLLNFIKNL